MISIWLVLHSASEESSSLPVVTLSPPSTLGDWTNGLHTDYDTIMHRGLVTMWSGAAHFKTIHIKVTGSYGGLSVKTAN